jgi:hypothetical protein
LGSPKFYRGRRKRLALKQGRNGLRIIIDRKVVFSYFFPRSRDLRSGWALAYYREYKDGRMHVAVTGYPNLQEPQYSGPEDPKLPEVKRTIFRSAANGKQLIEITFAGKIPIRRTDRLAFPPSKDFHYWEINYGCVKEKTD